MAEQEDFSKTSVDLSGEDVHWSQDMSYGTYLALGPLLKLQHPISDAHDEMLFIIMHQASELWIKACLFELGAAMEAVKSGDLRQAFKMLSRVAHIQANLKQSWDILATMTPVDYSKFRDRLGQSSGFQSYQYRELEFRLGNKNKRYVDAHKENTEAYEQLQIVLHEPSFYDLCLQHLAKTGLSIPDELLSRDWSEPYHPQKAVEDAWLTIYRNSEEYWNLYELAEKLVDLEHHFQSWRFAHMKTVERIIGYKRGTGGTGGVSYLVKALDIRFFPELWTARTAL